MVRLDFLRKFFPLICFSSIFRIVLRQATISIFCYSDGKNYCIDSIVLKLICYQILTHDFVSTFGYYFELCLVFWNRLKFLDSRNYWIYLIIFVFLTFLCKFVPVTCFLSKFKISFRQYTKKFDQLIRWQKLLSWFNNFQSRNLLYIKFCPTF